MRVTFSKEGLATYRGEDETDALLPRDESSCTLRFHLMKIFPYSIFIHVYSLLILCLSSPFGSEFEGWDNPFTEGGAISKDADLILRHNSTLMNKIHLIQFLIIPLQ